ncbi:MAG TPA: NADP-dependent oxidoreductase [Steroidobacteraceae bacterium]|nr:NADP-dependent oxidoreductase [Steroidobacteraceae bacterium]
MRVSGAWIVMATLLAGEPVFAADVPASMPVPASMHAAAIDRAGEAEVVRLHTLPVPKVGADEVLIAVHTAGVGVWDSDVRRHPGQLKHPRFPLVLGSDGAGTVAAVGADVHGFRVGEAVYAYNWDNPAGGFYAEYVSVPAEHVGHVPRGLGLREAGAAVISALTALQGIDDRLHLRAGQTLIIYGASGAVGSLAIQFAKLRGARVLATASGADAAAFVKGLGADAVVDARRDDVAAAVRAFAPGGADAILGLAGGKGLERCITALRPGGRLAFPKGIDPEPRARPGVTIEGYDAVSGPAQYARLAAAIEARALRVPIAAEYPLTEAAQAQRRMEAGHVLGKIVLRVR